MRLTIRSSRHRFAASAKHLSLFALPSPRSGARLTQVLGHTSNNPAIMNEQDLTVALDQHDQLLRGVAAGHLSISQFLEKYDNFYWTYALDGHEQELALGVLNALASRIEPHRRVAEEVLAVLTSDSLASQPPYQSAGRIGLQEASARLRQIAQDMPGSVA